MGLRDRGAAEVPSASGPTTSAAAAADAPPADAPPPPRASCVPHFDALWFCYSPAHQLREYYVHGAVDDCTGHWSALWDCLKQRTRFKGEGAGGAARARARPLWRLRTPEEARAAWGKEFGGGGGGGGGEAHGGGRPGVV